MIERRVEDWPVEKLDRERDRISFPEYQREKSLWSDEKKGVLIDSILHDIDIPKLYFNRLKDDSLEVIDGQQRLWSVWEFLDDDFACKLEDKKVYYSDLSTSQKEKIKKYKFQVTVFKEAGDEYLRELFVRLQWGLLLNTGEKLHAATGKMKQFIFGPFVSHSFIQHLGIPKRRYAGQTLCAQIAINLFARKKLKSFARTRYEDLLHFFSEYQHPQGMDSVVFGETTKRAIRTANELWITFDAETKKLRSRSYILSVFLFLDELIDKDGALSTKAQREFREFVLRLIKRLRDESRLGVDRENRELYSFETMLSSAPGERYQIERRHEKLEVYFSHFKKTGKIMGDK